MKTLVLIRHAKSDWGDHRLKDSDRPLNDRGLKDAPLMAKELHKLGLKPDILISSSAMRAMTTASFFAAQFKIKNDDIITENALYQADHNAYLAKLESLNNSINCVFLFGHNPEISTTLSYLLNNFYEQMPTCACVCIDFEINDWRDIQIEKGKLRFFLYPKMIK